MSSPAAIAGAAPRIATALASDGAERTRFEAGRVARGRIRAFFAGFRGRDLALGLPAFARAFGLTLRALFRAGADFFPRVRFDPLRPVAMRSPTAARRRALDHPVG